MNNQAAQTMPELPVALASIHADGYWTTDDRRPDWKWPARQRVFSEDQMHQYARDYAAMLAAAPAASGVHPDALPDGTLSKSTAKRVTALAAASVSERARALLATEFDRDEVTAAAARRIRASNETPVESAALRAIEQALTQQRGESSRPGMSYWAVQMPGKMPKLYGAYAFAELNWYPDEGGALVRLQEVERIGEPTTHQPSADAVREYVTELRAQADQKMGVAGACAHDGDRAHYKSAAQLLRRVADELESLLSGGSHA